ncbi:MAG: secretin N-terminal domain-containing protein [Candidatus Omnitrophota bacterium]
MKRPSHKHLFWAGFFCLFAVTGVVSAADPVPVPATEAAAAPEAAPAAQVPAVPEVSGVPEVAKPEDTISLDFKDAEIGSVLRVLSLKSNVNIVTGPEVKGLVTVRLDNVPWEKALDVILRTYNYVYERDGNIIRITTRDQMKLEPVETKTFILNYSKAKEIQASIMDMLSERGKVKSSERTNMLVVTDIPTNLYRIGEVIKKLDKVTNQAFIDSKIVRTQMGTAENLGIDWNVVGGLTQGAARPTTFPFSAVRDQGSAFGVKEFFPIQSGTALAPASAVNASDPRSFPNTATGTGFTYGTLSFTDFSAVLNLLEARTNSKIVSNPRIVVLNNQKASIQVGSDYPIPNFERNETTGSMEVSGYNYRQLGIVLNVTPHINSAEEILVDLKPEISSAGAMIEFIPGAGGLSAPSFNVTKATTQVLIHSGQTIAIGGLMSDNTGSSENKVPYLGDIPLVGKLFRSKRQTAGDENSKIETLFFVTVTTVDSQGQPAGAKVDGKNHQSQDDQAQKKPAATDAALGVKDSEKVVPSENANKDKPA